MPFISKSPVLKPTARASQAIRMNREICLEAAQSGKAPVEASYTSSDCAFSQTMAAENELDAASTSSTKSKHKVSTEQAGEHHEADSGPGDVEANLSKQESAPVYSIFSRRTRIFITVGSSVGALISPLSSTVYLPALTELESDFKVTNAKINLTLTCYTILQAIAPAFCGSSPRNVYHPNLHFQ